MSSERSLTDLGPIYEQCECGRPRLCKETYERSMEALEKHTPLDRDAVKSVAKDIGKQVAHHIEIMYPDAVKACPSTFLLSVKGYVYNEIMAALYINEDRLPAALSARSKFRRRIKAAYKRIRKEDSHE